MSTTFLRFVTAGSTGQRLAAVQLNHSRSVKSTMLGDQAMASSPPGTTKEAPLGTVLPFARWARKRQTQGAQDTAGDSDGIGWAWAAIDVEFTSLRLLAAVRRCQLILRPRLRHFAQRFFGVSLGLMLGVAQRARVL